MNTPEVSWEHFKGASESHLGTEHLVEFDEVIDRMVKITLPPKFGLIPKVITHAVPNLRGEDGTRKAIELIRATPIKYLERGE